MDRKLYALARKRESSRARNDRSPPSSPLAAPAAIGVAQAKKPRRRATLGDGPKVGRFFPGKPRTPQIASRFPRGYRL
jgi:hypothetical protein